MGNSSRQNDSTNGKDGEHATGIPDPNSTPASAAVNEVNILKNGYGLNIVCWNIRKGLITRELELKQLLQNEKIDIMFLTETDTHSLSSKTDYQIEGYETILPKMDNNNLVRILCLVKNDRINQISTVESLMSTDFPTIWLEYTSQKGAKFLIGGFYRVWTNAGIKCI